MPYVSRNTAIFVHKKFRVGEMELRNLHKKVDQLNEVQWPHLLDIQKTEIEVLTEIESELQQMKIKQNELIKARQHQTRHRSRQ